jgi:predicted  nucleic acid-binding Zn-ribbon protein
MKIEDFEELKERIETAKIKKSKAEGALEESMNRLKKEYGCSTIEEAEDKLAKLQKEIDSDEDKLEVMLKEIEGSVNWDAI